jgi:hypothetical protein
VQLRVAGLEAVYTPETALQALAGCSCVQLSLVMGRLYSHRQAADMMEAQEHSGHRPAEDTHAFRTDLVCRQNKLEVDRGIWDRIELGLFCSGETGLMLDMETR